MWPRTTAALEAEQRALAELSVDLWQPPPGQVRVGACWVTFPRGLSGPGAAGDPAWSAAVTMQGRRRLAEQTCSGEAAAPYLPGLMALRVGALLEEVVRALATTPDVLLLDATGLDHPRRCGLASHLGHVLGLPTVGVTHRPLVATGDWPADRRGASSPLRIHEEVVGAWLRTRPATRPLAVHPGWRTDVETSVRVVQGAVLGRRTPEPLRQARRLARRARAGVPTR